MGGFPECPWWWSRGGGPWSRGVRRGGPTAWRWSRVGGAPLVVGRNILNNIKKIYYNIPLI